MVIVALPSARQFDESIHDQTKVHKEAAAVWDIPHFQEIYQEKCGVKREDAEDKLKLAREREAQASLELLVTQIERDHECFRLYIKGLEFYCNKTSARLIDRNEQMYDNAHSYLHNRFERTMPVVVFNPETHSLGATNRQLCTEAQKELKLEA